MSLSLYQRVALRRDLPEHNLRRGDVATLLDTFRIPREASRAAWSRCSTLSERRSPSWRFPSRTLKSFERTRFSLFVLLPGLSRGPYARTGAASFCGPVHSAAIFR